LEARKATQNPLFFPIQWSNKKIKQESWRAAAQNRVTFCRQSRHSVRIGNSWRSIPICSKITAIQISHYPFNTRTSLSEKTSPSAFSQIEFQILEEQHELILKSLKRNVSIFDWIKFSLSVKVLYLRSSLRR
jgi:hypothetical protein